MSFTYSVPPARATTQKMAQTRKKDSSPAFQFQPKTESTVLARPEYKVRDRKPGYPEATHQSSYPPTAPTLQPCGGSYYKKQPIPSKHSATTRIIQQEEAQYNAYQELKREHLVQQLAQTAPSTLGGVEMSRREISQKREQQERDTRHAARFDSIRKKEKMEQYRLDQKQREDQVYQARKQKARAQAVKLEEKKIIEDAVKKSEDLVRQEETRNARLRFFTNLK